MIVDERFESGTKIKERTKKAINLNRHIHIGFSVNIPKYFKQSKYFLNL